jgi:hypothetical protein
MASAAGPLATLTNADRWALASVMRLFPSVDSMEAFFYPAGYLMGNGKVRHVNIADQNWIHIRDLAGQRLAVLTAHLEKLGDGDLRNFGS